MTLGTCPGCWEDHCADLSCPNHCGYVAPAPAPVDLEQKDVIVALRQPYQKSYARALAQVVAEAFDRRMMDGATRMDDRTVRIVRDEDEGE